jgi:4-amino-4-deoxy-L-arabinose transferase-like glycosyltransferase
MLMTADLDERVAPAVPAALYPLPTRPPVVEIVVPVLNEVQSLEASIRRLRAYLDEEFPFTALVTIADNGSTDGTLELARRLAGELAGVQVLHLDQRGRGRALRAAWSASAAQVVAYMDVDLSTGLEALLPLVAPLVSGHSDLAIGSRLARGAHVERSTKRELISRTYNRLLHLVMRNGFSDAQCGFKALRRPVAERLLPLVEDEAWFFDTELLLLAEREQLRIHEVPVDWVEDPDSRVDIVKTAVGDVKGMWRLKRRRPGGGGDGDRDGAGGRGAGRGGGGAGPRRLPPAAPVHRAALAGIAALAFGLYTWSLDTVGWGNEYYAAAVKSATVSWKAFFFASLDPGSFITVDKPPAAIWVQALSARIFGFSVWSILLPEALAGVASVLIVHRLVRRWAGDVPAHLAALGLAMTPVAVVMFRYDNPDAFLTFLCLAAAWALWSALETGRLRGLVLCGLLLGLAFDTKMLQAFLVLPAFGLAYLLFGRPRLARRVAHLAAAGAALVVSSSWWVVVVALWPAATRPYIGSTTDNSIVSLIFGYNGLSRIFGQSAAAGAGGSATAAAGGAASGGGGPNFGGAVSWLRMFNDIVGGQISWLLPLAGAGLVAGIVLARRARGDRLARAGWVLWGGWAVVTLTVFSRAEGIFHPYYTVQAAPGVAVLAGAGAVALWRLGRSDVRLCWLLPAAVAGTGIWAAVLLGRTPGYDTWLRPTVLAATVAAAGALLAASLRPRTWLAAGAGVASLLALLAGPAAYAVTSISSPTTGALASAGPSTTASLAAAAGGAGGLPNGAGGGARGAVFGPPAAGGAIGGAPNAAGAGNAGPAGLAGPAFAGAGGPTRSSTSGGGPTSGGPGGATTSPSSATEESLVRYLEAHRGSAEYLVAGFTSNATAPIIIDSGDPVVTIGGFNGSDPTPTLAQFEQMVARGEVRYVLVDGNGGGVGGPGGATAQAIMQSIEQWVVANGHAVTPSAYGGSSAGSTLYEV